MLQFDLEKDVKVPGTPWTLGRFTEAMRLELQEWANEATYDPAELLERFGDKLSQADFAVEYREAKSLKTQLKNFTIECPLGRKLFGELDGASRLLWVRLKAKHPAATLDDAMALLLGKAAEEAAKKKPESPAGESSPPA